MRFIQRFPKILHAAGIEVTASAVTQRRAQIAPEAFRAAFDNFNAACTDNDLFRGYRLFAVDGTTVNLPRNVKSASFVINDGIPKGVNQLPVTPLYDLLSRTFADVVVQPEPKKDEIGALISKPISKAFEFKNRVLFLTGEFRKSRLYDKKWTRCQRARKNAAIYENHGIFGTPDPI